MQRKTTVKPSETKWNFGIIQITSLFFFFFFAEICLKRTKLEGQIGYFNNFVMKFHLKGISFFSLTVDELKPSAYTFPVVYT